MPVMFTIVPPMYDPCSGVNDVMFGTASAADAHARSSASVGHMALASARL